MRGGYPACFKKRDLQPYYVQSLQLALVAGLPNLDSNDVELAILLGSFRKYVALINNGRGTPITSLRYFTTLFDEVKQDIPASYWVHVERRVRDAERQWGGFEVPAKSDEIRVTK